MFATWFIVQRRQNLSGDAANLLMEKWKVFDFSQVITGWIRIFDRIKYIFPIRSNESEKKINVQAIGNSLNGRERENGINQMEMEVEIQIQMQMQMQLIENIGFWAIYGRNGYKIANIASGSTTHVHFKYRQARGLKL